MRQPIHAVGTGESRLSFRWAARGPDSRGEVLGRLSSKSGVPVPTPGSARAPRSHASEEKFKDEPGTRNAARAFFEVGRVEITAKTFFELSLLKRECSLRIGASA